VVGLEFLKAFLRLILFRITSRPLITPPLPERDLQPPSLESASMPIIASPLPTPDHLQNNRVPPSNLPIHPSKAANIDEYLLPKALKVSSVREPRHLVPQVASFTALSELIAIARPLAYVLALTYSTSATFPYLLSVIMDFVSRKLRPPTLPFSASSEILANEYARRDRLLIYYLFKGPIWKTFTKPRLESFADKTENKPVLSIISALVRDWVPLIDEYYYYTAT